MGEILAGIIGAVVGALLAAGFDAWRERRRRMDEEKRLAKDIYLDYLVAVRSLVEVAKDLDKTRQKLGSHEAESVELGSRIDVANRRLDAEHVRNADLASRQESLKERLRSPAAQRDLDQLTADRDQLAAEIVEAEASFREAGTDVDRLQSASDGGREQLTRIDTEYKVQAEKASTMRRDVDAAFARLIAVANENANERMLDRTQALLAGLAAYEDAPRSEQAYLRYQEAETAYILAVRTEVD